MERQSAGQSAHQQDETLRSEKDRTSGLMGQVRTSLTILGIDESLMSNGESLLFIILTGLCHIL